MNIGRKEYARGRRRRLWLQIHQWIGLGLAVALIPLGVSGSLLVWDEWTDGIANPHRYAVTGRAALPVSAYAERGAAALGPEYRLASVALPAEADRPVVV